MNHQNHISWKSCYLDLKDFAWGKMYFSFLQSAFWEQAQKIKLKDSIAYEIRMQLRCRNKITKWQKAHIYSGLVLIECEEPLIRCARYLVDVHRRTLYYSAVCYFLKPTQSPSYCLCKPIVFICFIPNVFFSYASSSSSSLLSPFIKTGYFEALLEAQKLNWSFYLR